MTRPVSSVITILSGAASRSLSQAQPLARQPRHAEPGSRAAAVTAAAQRQMPGTELSGEFEELWDIRIDLCKRFGIQHVRKQRGGRLTAWENPFRALADKARLAHRNRAQAKQTQTHGCQPWNGITARDGDEADQAHGRPKQQDDSAVSRRCRLIGPKSNPPERRQQSRTEHKRGSGDKNRPGSADRLASPQHADDGKREEGNADRPANLRPA